MSSAVREGETIGSLDARLLLVESSLSDGKGQWFGDNPWKVLGLVIVTLASGGWIFYTYQIERIEQNHKNEIDNIRADYQVRIDWLKEQNVIAIKNNTDQCNIENMKIKAENAACLLDKKDVSK